MCNLECYALVRREKGGTSGLDKVDDREDDYEDEEDVLKCGVVGCSHMDTVWATKERLDKHR